LLENKNLKYMATFFLIISAILFITTFGIHMIIYNGDPLDKPMYTRDPFMSVIPYISGFVLPVIPLTLVFEFHWLVMFFINFGIVFFLWPVLTKGFLARMASGRGFGIDMMYSFIGAIITLIIGIVAL
jgi:hypothetical protein